MQRLRWKKHAKATGLRSVGAGPRGSDLHDGTTTFATVYPKGGNWREDLLGWYFVCPERDGVKYINTCHDLSSSEEEAKKQAVEYVKEQMSKVKK